MGKSLEQVKFQDENSPNASYVLITSPAGHIINLVEYTH